MIIHKKSGFRLISILLCVILAIPVIFVSANQPLKVVFIGNSNTPNNSIKSYGELTAKYLEKALSAKIEFDEISPIEIDSKDFINKAEKEVLPENYDFIFWEINISRKNKGSEKSVKEKISALIECFCSGEKIPAIYFVYTPNEGFMDYRTPYAEMAKYYGIEELDGFSALKKQFVQKKVETKDIFTVGSYVGEDGHKLLGEAIIYELKNVSNLKKTPARDKKALGNPDSYRVSVVSTPEIIPPEEGAVFYVSKNGTGNGTVDAPFGSLELAKDAIRKLKNKEGNNFKGATVYIREGDYFFNETFNLTSNDSATDTTKIIYSAYPGEKVRFTNANALNPEKWQLVTDETTLSRIRENARGKVYSYNLNGEVFPLGGYRDSELLSFAHRNASDTKMKAVLSANGITERRAAYPNGGYSRVSQMQTTERNKIYYDDNVGDRWKTADNVWMKGMLQQGYLTDYIKVKNFDFDKKYIQLVSDATYGVEAGHTWSIFNLLEELDMEGEWFLDEKTGLLYYYPRGDIREQDILYSTNVNAIVKMTETKNITFKDIEFTTCSGSAVEIADGVANTVENCIIANTGWHGVYITCTNNKIGPGKNGVIGCHIYNNASSGVTVKGGDRMTLTPQYDYVVNCLLENFAYEAHSETGALQSISAVGVIFKNNTIHNDDSCAIWMGGNDELIEYNEIYNIGWETDDYGVLYGTSSGAVTQGVTIRNNYFHDCVYSGLTYVYGKLGGVYFDALRNNGAVVDNNAFINFDEPIFFATNQNMTARGNISLDCKHAVVTGYYSHVNKDKIEGIHERIRNELADGSIFNYTSQNGTPDTLVWRSILYPSKEMTEEQWETYYKKYPWVEHYLERGPLVHRDNVASGNASFNSSSLKGIDLPQEAVASIDSSNNYVTTKAIEYTESGSEFERMDKAMSIASERVEGFAPWDIRETGAFTEPVNVGKFDILYPADNEENIDLKVFPLCWDYASGADEYTVTIANDAEFKNIVFEGKTNVNYIHPKNLSYGGKRYYWKVKAESWNERIAGTPENSNGVRSFVTKRTEEVDKKALNDAVITAEKFLDGMVEGTESGMYPEGSIATMKAVFDEAVAVNENVRAKQKQINDIALQLDETRIKIMSTVIIGETNFADIFNSPENILIGVKGVSGKDNPKLTADEKGITFKGSGAVFANRDFGNHEIVSFKAKFDFSGIAAGSNYTLFSLRAKNYSDVLHDVSNYAFLVTKDNIELQAFKKPGNVGKMYLTVPNTFIEEGKEHHIEFGAIPCNGGKSMRLLLAIDGKLVYDEIDSTNIIADAGKVGFANSRDTQGVTIMQPDAELPYPTLIEQLNDPNSVLNKK